MSEWPTTKTNEPDRFIRLSNRHEIAQPTEGDDMTFKIAPRKRTVHRGHVVARPTESDDE